MLFRRFGGAAIASVAALFFAARAQADVIAVDRYEAYRDKQPFADVSERDFGLATAHMYLRYARSRDEERAGSVSDLFMGGLSFRAIYGKRVGFGVGLGFELGASRALGFGAGIDFYPAGVAIALGPTGYIGIFLGIGINGVAVRVPFAYVMPAEARLEFDVGRAARLGALFSMGWTPFEEPRKNASTLLSFADETLMALTARFGKTFPQYGANVGRGYFIRLERREQMQTIWLGASFGVEIDVAQ